MGLGATLSVLKRIVANPSNRGHRVMPLVRFAAWQAYKRTTRRHLDVRVFGDMVLRCYPDSSSASAVLYAHRGLADFHEMSFLRHYLRSGDQFLDIGANVGVYTLLAASVIGPSGRIASFEPGSPALARLRENIALNRLERMVEVFDVAASDRAGSAWFTTGRDSTNQLVEGEMASTSVREIRCQPLDGLFEHERRFSLGKIDVEGAEPLVLRGAETLLAHGNPPVWILEINGRLREFGCSESDLEAWLLARGYHLALYDARARRLTLTERAWAKAPNVLSVHLPQLPQITERLRDSASR